MSTIFDKILQETELLSSEELLDLQIELLKRTQVYHRRRLYLEIKHLLSFDVFSHLPVLLSIKILSYLDAPSLCAISQCSQKCKELANDNKLWYKLCVYKGYTPYEHLPFPKWDTQNRPSSPRCKLPDIMIQKDSNQWIEEHLSYWKCVYLKGSVLTCNWNYGLYSTKLLSLSNSNSSNKEPITAMTSKGQLLVTGSRNGSCTVWNLYNFTIQRTLTRHTDEINSLLIIQDESPLVISGCSDGLIRCFIIITGQLLWTVQSETGAGIEIINYCNSLLIASCTDLSLYVWEVHKDSHPVAMTTLHGHTKSITCMELTHESIVYTGSWDGTVRIWNCLENSNIHILSAHLEGVLCILCVSDGQLLSGGGDGLIKLWEPVTGQLLTVMKGHTQEVLCLTANKDTFISSSADSTIRIWTHKGTCTHVLGEHIGLVRCLQLKGNYLISGGDRKRINIWNMKNGQLLHTVHRQQNLICLMEVNDTQIITASPNEGIMGIINYW